MKGFTLIELLVVIAIIGILAGIMFVAINPKAQSDKAEDARIKSDLDSARVQADLAFSENRNYTNLCSGYINNLASTCGSDAYAWAVGETLSDNLSNWCVDSSGYVGLATIAHEDGDIICMH